MLIDFLNGVQSELNKPKLTPEMQKKIRGADAIIKQIDKGTFQFAEAQEIRKIFDSKTVVGISSKQGGPMTVPQSKWLIVKTD